MTSDSPTVCPKCGQPYTIIGQSENSLFTTCKQSPDGLECSTTISCRLSSALKAKFLEKAKENGYSNAQTALLKLIQKEVDSK